MKRKFAKQTVIQLEKEDTKKLEHLCKVHNRSINKEIQIMIRYYHKLHLKMEKYG